MLNFFLFYNRFLYDFHRAYEISIFVSVSYKIYLTSQTVPNFPFPNYFILQKSLYFNSIFSSLLDTLIGSSKIGSLS
jgi:hypothetical protein